MISQNEVESMRNELMGIIHQLRVARSQPGRSEAMRTSDSITAAIAAAQLNTLEYVLGNQTSPMIRSRLSK